MSHDAITRRVMRLTIRARTKRAYSGEFRYGFKPGNGSLESFRNVYRKVFPANLVEKMAESARGRAYSTAGCDDCGFRWKDPNVVDGLCLSCTARRAKEAYPGFSGIDRGVSTEPVANLEPADIEKAIFEVAERIAKHTVRDPAVIRWWPGGFGLDPDAPSTPREVRHCSRCGLAVPLLHGVHGTSRCSYCFAVVKA